MTTCPTSFLPLALLLGLVAAQAHTAFYRARGRRALGRGLARFTPQPALGRFEETAPKAFFGPRKAPHAVLLVHGFSGSAASFKFLLPALERQGIPYYAPNLTGFGLDDAHALEAARVEDWRRDVQQAYALLASSAEEVSVVAFSWGSLLACELAKTHPVRHLVLVAPYFFLASKAQRRLRALLDVPPIAWCLERLLPYMHKPRRAGSETAADLRDPSTAAGLFTYSCLPMRALREMWRLPVDTDLRSLRCRSLDLLYGGQERTSDVPALIEALTRLQVRFGVQEFPHSGHNLLEDFDRDEAVAAILQVLQGRPLAPDATALQA